MLWSGRNHNFAILTFDGLLFFLGMIFISYESVLPVFLVRLGAPRLAIAVVPVAIALGINLPSIMVARMVERAPRKRRIVLTYGLGQRLPWAIVAVAIPFLALSRPGWLIAIVLLGVLVATASAGIVIPAFFHIMSVTIPVERRGRLFAVRSVVSYLAGIGGGFLVSLVLEQVRFPENYSILYATAAVILFAGLWVFSFIREPEAYAPQPKQRRPPLSQDVRRILAADRSFRFYVLSRVFLMIAFATTSFFPVYLVEQFGLPDSVSGLFATITAATFVVVNPILGTIADRVGYKPVVIVSFLSLIVAAGVGLAGVAAPFAYALIALVALSQSVNLFALNMTVEFAPEGQVPTYIGVGGLFMGIVAPVALVTGFLVDRFGYDALFWLTTAAAVVGLVIMILGVEEPRGVRRRLNLPDAPI